MHRVRAFCSTLLLSVLLMSGVPERVQAQITYETEIHTSVGFFGAYTGWSNSVLWDPGLFRLGGGVDLYAGTAQFDFHAVPHLRAEIGWFYLTGGWNLVISPAPIGYQPLQPGVVVATGIAPDLIQAGYGRLGFDLGTEVLIRFFQNPADAPLGAAVVAPWNVERVFNGLLANVLEIIVSHTQLRLGLLYTFPLN